MMPPAVLRRPYTAAAQQQHTAVVPSTRQLATLTSEITSAQGSRVAVQHNNGTTEHNALLRTGIHQCLAPCTDAFSGGE